MAESQQPDLPPPTSAPAAAATPVPAPNPNALITWATPVCDYRVMLACLCKTHEGHAKTVFTCRVCGVHYCQEKCQVLDYGTRHKNLCKILSLAHADEAFSPNGFVASLLYREEAPDGEKGTDGNPKVVSPLEQTPAAAASSTSSSRLFGARVSVYAFAAVRLAAALASPNVKHDLDEMVTQILTVGLYADADKLKKDEVDYGVRANSHGDSIALFIAAALAHAVTATNETSAQLVLLYRAAFQYLSNPRRNLKPDAPYPAYALLSLDVNKPIAPAGGSLRLETSSTDAASPRALWKVLEAKERKQYNNALIIYLVPAPGPRVNVQRAHALLLWSGKTRAVVMQSVFNVYAIGDWIGRYVTSNKRPCAAIDRDSPWATEWIPREHVPEKLFDDLDTLVSRPADKERYRQRKAAYRRICALSAETPLPFGFDEKGGFPAEFQVLTLPVFLDV